MLNAMYQHMKLLLLFKHNGQGLKTEKSFTMVLILICLCLSIISNDNNNILSMITNIICLAFVYFITNKELVNGIFMAIITLMLINLVLPVITILFFVWIVLAISSMQNKYKNSNKP